MSESRTEIKQFTFDKVKQKWVCSVHGEINHPAWVMCWNGCDDGYFDGYEDDPLMFDEGDLLPCTQCNGEGGWNVCPQCNANNPYVEI